MKKIQILGTGCPKCKKLAENAEAAAKELGIEYELEKMDIKPDNAWQRIKSVLDGDRTKAETTLLDLVFDVFDLVEKHVPEIDYSRLRKGINTRVRACPDKPDLTQ